MFVLNWNLSIVYLCAIVGIGSVRSDIQHDLTEGLLNALKLENFSNVIETVRNEYATASVRSPSQPLTGKLQDGYDDALCILHLEALRDGLNKSQLWAFQGM